MAIWGVQDHACIRYIVLQAVRHNLMIQYRGFFTTESLLHPPSLQRSLRPSATYWLKGDYFRPALHQVALSFGGLCWSGNAVYSEV